MARDRWDAPTAYVFGPAPKTAPLIVDAFARVALLVLMSGALVATLSVARLRPQCGPAMLTVSTTR